jgi:TonB family protein
MGVRKYSLIIAACFLSIALWAQKKDFLNEELEKQQEEIGAAYVRLSEFKDGVYDVTINYIGGQLFMTGQYADDKFKIAHGHFAYYTMEGVKESEGDYFKGVKVGTWKRWDESGAPLPDRNYKEAPKEDPSTRKEDSNKSTQAASFPDFANYVNQHLKYPDKAVQAGTKGIVYVAFTVDATGAVKNAKVSKGVSAELDAAAMQMILGMPKWTPAQRNGTAIDSDVLVPISFE